MHACKSGPFGCTPKPRRQADTVRTYTTQQLNDTDNTTCTTQCEQHDLALSLKSTTKSFIEFPNFNWSILSYVTSFSYDLPIKNTHLQTSDRFSHALSRAQNQMYIKAGPQSSPVMIKATLSKTQCWCRITPSNTSLTECWCRISPSNTSLTKDTKDDT